MTLLGILSIICRAIGLIQLADKLWEGHLARVREQNVANSPKTDDEWTQAGKDGKL